MNYEIIYNILSNPVWTNSQRRKFIEVLIEWLGFTDEIKSLISDFNIDMYW